MREIYSFTLALPVISENNACEHWRVRHKRSKHQKNEIWAFLHQEKPILPMPCHVLLIRLSPRQLDSDNLQGAFKYIRDAVADYLIPGLRPGRADGDDRIQWSYQQQKSSLKGICVKFFSI